MKNICFIGVFDKLDMILYLSKILKGMGKDVLIVDATQLQKARYIVPTIQPIKSYITRFEDVDIAVGFESYEEIERYIELTEDKKMEYAYALVNIDCQELFEKFHNQDTIKNFFVTSFELYSIRKGLETIRKINQPIPITKLVFSRQADVNDNYYLDYLALGYKIIWEDNIVNFPYDTQDIEAIIENQKNHKISLKNLTQAYKSSLEYAIITMIPNVDVMLLKKTIKNIEKEG